MKTKVISLIFIFIFGALGLGDSNLATINDALQQEHTPQGVIVSVDDANSSGFQEGSIYSEQTFLSAPLHTCGLTDNGTYCWGFNLYGTLGNGGTVDSTTASLVSGSQNMPFREISGGGTVTCGIAMNNSVLCWGGGYSLGLSQSSVS